MTLATSCTHRAVVETATAPRRSTSRLASALNWLAARIERSAELRARRNPRSRWLDRRPEFAAAIRELRGTESGRVSRRRPCSGSG